MRRLKSFRLGDSSEDLATVILSRFAIVTGVRRQDDFGIDQICSLAREDEKYVYSGSSFGVQTKSIGHRPISYGGFSNRNCQEYLQRCGKLLGLTTEPKETSGNSHDKEPSDASESSCPKCQSPMLRDE